MFDSSIFETGKIGLIYVMLNEMAEAGYKSLISYKLAQIAFDLGWDFV